MPLHGIDHVELWVGNAEQAAYFFTRAFGFREVAYPGLETGVRDRVSHVLEQGRIRLVLTGALRSDIADRRPPRPHGDGVKVIALGVPDVDHAYREATARGAGASPSPTTSATSTAPCGSPTIATYGETCTPSSSAATTTGPFLPGYVRRAEAARPPATSHARSRSTTSSATSSSGRWTSGCATTSDVFGMTEMIHFSDEAISTEYSALMSKVVADGNGRVKFPINEPAEGKRKSQIDEYLEFYEGAGAQHLAVATRDIVGTVARAAPRAASSSCASPTPTTTRSPAGSARSPSQLERPARRRASSSTATTRATCCRSSPSRSATGRRSSSRSSSATARAASARATSRRSSRRSSASRTAAGTSDALPRASATVPRQAPRGDARGRRAARPRRSSATRASAATSRSSTTSTPRAGCGGRELHADRARRVGAGRPRPPARRTRAGARRAATPWRAAGC